MWYKQSPQVGAAEAKVCWRAFTYAPPARRGLGVPETHGPVWTPALASPLPLWSLDYVMTHCLHLGVLNCISLPSCPPDSVTLIDHRLSALCIT